MRGESRDRTRFDGYGVARDEVPNFDRKYDKVRHH
jgi:hypothetical protein